MTRRTRTAFVEASAHLRNMRERRRARRAGDMPAPPRPENSPTRFEAPVAPPESASPCQPRESGLLSDIMAEREVITARIDALRHELAEQEKHLEAVDVIIAMQLPLQPAGKAADSKESRRRSDVLDAQFVVIPRK
jgi:hypothetical protein